MQYLIQIFDFFAWIFFWYTLTSFYINYFLFSETQFGLQTPQYSLKEDWVWSWEVEEKCKTFKVSVESFTGLHRPEINQMANFDPKNLMVGVCIARNGNKSMKFVLKS